MRLDSSQRERCREVMKRLDAIWQADDKHQALAQAMAGAVSGAATVVYDWGPGDDVRVVGHTFDFDVRQSPWVRRNLGRSYRAYDPRDPVNAPNGFMLGTELARRWPVSWHALRDHFLTTHRLRDQLRAIVFERGQFLAYCGLFAHDDRAQFHAGEAAVLNALLPALRDRLLVLRAWRSGDGQLTTLDRVLDAFDEPAFLLSEHGTVVHANRSARAVHRSLPSWLRSCTKAEPPSHMLRRVSLEIGGALMILAVERSSRVDPNDSVRANWAVRWGLAPQLARVAALVMAGQTDREIALRVGLSYATVRTYVARIYARVGVSSRVELLRAATGESP